MPKIAKEVLYECVQQDRLSLGHLRVPLAKVKANEWTQIFGRMIGGSAHKYFGGFSPLDDHLDQIINNALQWEAERVERKDVVVTWPQGIKGSTQVLLLYDGLDVSK
jgi:hypothetical protein